MNRMSVRARARRERALERREADVETYTAAGDPRLAKAKAEVDVLRRVLGIYV